MAELKIPILNRCPSGHDSTLSFTRADLVEKIAADNLRFYCFKCDELYPATPDQKSNVEKLIQSQFSQSCDELIFSEKTKCVGKHY